MQIVIVGSSAQSNLNTVNVPCDADKPIRMYVPFDANKPIKTVQFTNNVSTNRKEGFEIAGRAIYTVQ